MGYVHPATGQSVVTHIIGPGPAAVFEEDSFTPDGAYQLAMIDHIYQTSGRISTFLGDWHSHPGSAAFLSPKDYRALSTVARSAESLQPSPVMAILAGGKPWRLAVWRYRRALLRSRVTCLTVTMIGEH
jgi:integrative and conjugative element protein (TIGR02256 family)